ncbi:MAG TPA: hypothetical protein VFT62_08975 [Mycobacteriales bacterium]|nr:hypothetical protein [Mycobacteriales bacterium]
MTDVYLEVGARWTFACAIDWPGWCRRGKGEEAAIEELVAYATRYTEAIGQPVDARDLRVIGRVPGDKTTDFGAPHIIGPTDDGPLAPDEAHRITGLVVACWDAFDRGVATAPATLRKGPRGGGRDRDQIADHVREAERAYASKAGVRIPPRTPWPDQRRMLAEVLRAGAPDGSWPMRYAARRIAWHVLDHLWEIEDKST